MTFHFESADAETLGIHSAVILYNIRFWLRKNKANKHNIIDGRVWTKNSTEAFSELFPFLSTRQVRSAIDKAREAGILLAEYHNENVRNRTLWYSINEEEFCLENPAPFAQNVTHPFDKIVKSPNDKMVKCIIRNTDSNPYSNHILVEPKVSTESESVSPSLRERQSSLKKEKAETGSGAGQPAMTFDEFWNIYDKKRGRRAAERLWKKLKLTEIEKIKQHVPKYVATTEQQYRKDPERYIKHKTFEDEIIGSQQSKQTSPMNVLTYNEAFAHAAERGIPFPSPAYVPFQGGYVFNG